MGSEYHINGGRLFFAAASKDPRNSLNQNLKNNIFVDTTMSKFFVIYPSGEISLRTPLITGTLEFSKTI
jgi:hypothetical protein